MRSSGNQAVLVHCSYALQRVDAKFYVYDELGRIVTVTQASLTRKQLERMLAGIRLYEDEHAQDELPF